MIRFIFLSDFLGRRSSKHLAIYKDIAIMQTKVKGGLFITVTGPPIDVCVVQSMQDTRTGPSAILQCHVLTVRNEVCACRIVVFFWIGALKGANRAIIGPQSGSFPLD